MTISNEPNLQSGSKHHVDSSISSLPPQTTVHHQQQDSFPLHHLSQQFDGTTPELVIQGRVMRTWLASTHDHLQAWIHSGGIGSNETLFATEIHCPEHISKNTELCNDMSKFGDEMHMELLLSRKELPLTILTDHLDPPDGDQLTRTVDAIQLVEIKQQPLKEQHEIKATEACAIQDPKPLFEE